VAARCRWCGIPAAFRRPPCAPQWREDGRRRRPDFCCSGLSNRLGHPIVLTCLFSVLGDGRARREQATLSFEFWPNAGVSPDLGTITLLVISPDESVLYINDTRRRHIRAFDMAPNGTLARQTDHVFADLDGSEPGVPDGMKVDSTGNVYCGGAGGIWVLDPKGKKLGRIIHGKPQTTNIAFGGPDWETLYFTNANFLGSVNLKIAGVPVPSPKRS
jgi:hypothetical protein